jgi:hypothetical protein
MRIRHFVVSITCMDNSDVKESDVEDAIIHGMIEGGGPCHAAYLTELILPFPDIDYTRSGPKFDRAVGEWDRRAAQALNGFSLKRHSNERQVEEGTDPDNARPSGNRA